MRSKDAQKQLARTSLKCLSRCATNGGELWLECKGTRHQWSGPEEKKGTRLRDRCLDGWYGNRRAVELEERKAPSSAGVVKDRVRFSKALDSKIPNFIITELFYSRILHINRGSLHTRIFRRILLSVHTYIHLFGKAG